LSPEYLVEIVPYVLETLKVLIGLAKPELDSSASLEGQEPVPKVEADQHTEEGDVQNAHKT